MRLLLLGLFTLVCQQLLAFYPIDPRPLRMLIIESEYIARVQVIETSSRNRKTTPSDLNTDYAIVQIKETWQGHITEKQVKVWFCKRMICPSPGVLEDKEEALVFLDKDLKTGQYEIHALSYGVKHGLSRHDFDTYKARILEMQDILRIKDSAQRLTRTVDWLITCSQSPITRSDALSEISIAPALYNFGERPENALPWPVPLTTIQRRQLFDIMMNTDTLDYLTIPLAALVRGVNDSALLQKLKENLLLNSRTWVSQPLDLMMYISEITQHPALLSIYKRVSRLNYWKEEYRAQVHALITEFIQVMQQAALPPAASPQETITG